MTFHGRQPDDPMVKSLVEHLADLRRAVIWTAIFLTGGMLVAIPLAPTVFSLVKIPYIRAGLEPIITLRVIQVGGGLSILMRVVVWSGLLFSLPFIVGAAGSFVFPGLSHREKGIILKAGGTSIGLFILGVWMGFFWTVPYALQMMSQIETWMGTPSVFWETAGYVSFVMKLLLAFGVAFQLPLLVFVLGVMGVVTSRQLRDKRRHVIVGLLVVSMLMTPPDPFTMVLMAGPLIALYEICIWLVWVRERRRSVPV